MDAKSPHPDPVDTAAADLRRIADQVAAEIQSSFVAHGVDVKVIPSAPIGGRAYVELAPFSVELARRVMDGLARSAIT
jgi:hypothetical protein